MYVCQSSPSHTSALGTWKWNEGLDSKKLCCDCEKTWFVSLTCGRSRCDLSARLVQVVTPFSLRVNVLTARLILISGLLQCYFRGRPPVETRPGTVIWVICHPWTINQSKRWKVFCLIWLFLSFTTCIRFNKKNCKYPWPEMYSSQDEHPNLGSL